MFERLEEILAQDPLRPRGDLIEIGRSREGRGILAVQHGSGPRILSLIGGCHADEPTGPILLRKLSSYLHGLPADDPILTACTWNIIPHTNPDAEAINQRWYRGDEESFDFERYCTYRFREAPGEDLEFGFPRGPKDTAARVEAQAIYRWWRSMNTPFDFHVSLHGMAVAEGPWFLVEPAWIRRISGLKTACQEEVRSMGYELFEWDRKGEKGFHRCDKGFSTRPNSGAMARYFLERDEPDTAALFRPSSMECIRSFGGDPLTLVSEMPLFIGPRLSPKSELTEYLDKVKPMPLRDQMRLQWRFICSGISCLGESE